MRRPKGSGSAGSRRCCPVTRLAASLPAASLASRRARRRVVLSASACLSSSSGGRTFTCIAFAIFERPSARQRHCRPRGGATYRRSNWALQLTHARDEPWTMRLFGWRHYRVGWRHYRISKIRGRDGDRRSSAGLIIIVAARLVGNGPFREAVCTAICQGDAH